MELESFVSRNLKKQDNIEELAMEMITEQIKIIPINGVVKATIIDNGHRLIISMVAQTEKNIFSSESLHIKDKLKKVSHSWIIGAIRLVLQDLIHQINRKLYLNFKYDRTMLGEQTVTKKIDLLPIEIESETYIERLTGWFTEFRSRNRQNTTSRRCDFQ